MSELPKYQQSWLSRAFNRVAEEIDHHIGWDKLPKPLGLLVLIGLRDMLRAKNLYDTNVAPARNLPPLEPFSAAVRTVRTPDGSYNDLSEPRMGMAGARFGRNIPPAAAWPATREDFMSPDPRLISNRLLGRKQFIPATSLNMLAATWIQFMVKDTAFRIFILMASRRLNSDRFFTDDFTPEVYSDTGYRWVADNDMTSVLLRHYPQLRSALRGIKNPFAPWLKAAS